MKISEHITELWVRLKKVGIVLGVALVIMLSISKMVLGYYMRYLEVTSYAFSPLEEIQAMMTISFSFALVIGMIYLVYQGYLYIRPIIKIDRALIKLGGVSVLAVISYMIGSTFVAKRLLLNLMESTIFINQWSILSVLSVCSMVGVAFAIASLIIFIIPSLVKIGIISIKQLTSFRKYVIFGLLALVSIITPTGDMVSLGVTFVPIYLSYETGIISSKLIGGKHNVRNTRNRIDSNSSSSPFRSTESNPMG